MGAQAGRWLLGFGTAAALVAGALGAVVEPGCSSDAFTASDGGASSDAASGGDTGAGDAPGGDGAFDAAPPLPACDGGVKLCEGFEGAWGPAWSAPVKNANDLVTIVNGPSDLVYDGVGALHVQARPTTTNVGPFLSLDLGVVPTTRLHVEAYMRFAWTTAPSPLGVVKIAFSPPAGTRELFSVFTNLDLHESTWAADGGATGASDYAFGDGGTFDTNHWYHLVLDMIATRPGDAPHFTLAVDGMMTQGDAATPFGDLSVRFGVTSTTADGVTIQTDVYVDDVVVDWD